MTRDWLILHAGALGDLVLTIQLALRLPGAGEAGPLRILSRTNPGDLSTCRPSIVRQSPEGLGLHWLFGGHDHPPPERLRDLVCGARVLSALGGVHTIVHHRLEALQPAALYSIDPRPQDGVERHITQQWQTQLEAQGLRVPKCIDHRPSQRGVVVSAELRQRGKTTLRQVGVDSGCVAIHPGSGGRAKCWPLRCFVDVGRRLQANERAVVCFLVGPAELETWTEPELAALREGFAVLCCSEADELLAILAAVRVLVGNDAGPAHLAGLLGTPTVTLFGPTSSSVWRPLGVSARVVAGDPDAHPDAWGIEREQVVALVADRL